MLLWLPIPKARSKLETDTYCHYRRSH